MARAAGHLRIALLAYRGNPYSGGQGVYARNLAGALQALGHTVEVFSGPPYPRLPGGVALTALPSLDLYRPEAPFRRARPIRDAIDLAEFGVMCVGGFPEPLTFSLRALREIGRRRREFDVVHDNQCLGYGLLRMPVPVIATIHHPITIDRDLELAHATTRKRKIALRRWYAFTRMQGRVARRLPRVITVSEISRDDIVREFGVARDRIAVVPNGVDTELFAPVASVARIPGRIITTASADVPLKGLVPLLEALAKLRTERQADLVVIGRLGRRSPARDAIARLGLEAAVQFRNGVDQEHMAAIYAEASVAAVPSLYEGFSLPALEAMACGVPLVATSVGALPEICGGGAGIVVPPGDVDGLVAALRRVLDDAALRERLGQAGRARVLERFTWDACARATAEQYEGLVRPC
jgi:glycosyltransferase involved in cell wall biosynthesis